MWPLDTTPHKHTNDTLTQHTPSSARTPSSAHYKKMVKQAAANENEASIGRLYTSTTGLLMRKTEPGKADQIVVPDSLKAFILRRYHGPRGGNSKESMVV